MGAQGIGYSFCADLDWLGEYTSTLNETLASSRINDWLWRLHELLQASACDNAIP